MSAKPVSDLEMAYTNKTFTFIRPRKNNVFKSVVNERKNNQVTYNSYLRILCVYCLYLIRANDTITHYKLSQTHHSLLS